MKKFSMAVIAMSLAVPLWGEVAAGVKAGTLGAGIELAIGFSDSAVIRVGAQGGTYEPTIDQTDIEYDGEIDLRSANLFLDIHPRGGVFHFTIGGIYNDSSVTAQSNEDTVLIVNDVPYPVSQVGTLFGDITFDELAPYAGIGWGHAFRRGGSWTVTFDVGAAYIGAADVELRAVPNDPSIVLPQEFLDDLQAEEDELEEELSSYEFYPVVSLGVLYRF